MDRMPFDEPRDLENLLNDPYAKPEPLTLALIRNITEELSTRIGSGGYGDVYLGVLGDKKKKVAVKNVKYTDKTNVDEIFRSEVDCFKRAKHVNIARLLGYCADKPTQMTEYTNGINGFVEMPQRFLCLEYAPYGDLQEYIEGKSEGDDWTTLYQMIMGICRGIEHIHGRHIIHLDLKPKNILLDAYMRTKITDFGSAKCFPKDQSSAIMKCIGTEEFMAPEMKSINEISYKSDIYALGATIATLLMGNESKDYNKVKWLEENLDDKKCPKEKRSFIDIAYTCMNHDPYKRKTILEIINQLKEMGLDDRKIYDSEDVIKVEPQDMRLRPFDPENVESSTLNIINRTGQHVAYKIIWKNSTIEHIRHIIGPRETHAIDMPREASEMFLVKSIVVTKKIDNVDIPRDMFDTVVEGRRIYEVEVAVFVEGDTADGTTGLQVTPSSNGPLEVEPMKLDFPFERKRLIPSSLYLINHTYEKVAFKLSNQYRNSAEPFSISNVFMLPLLGIVPPRTIYTLVVTAIDREMIRRENPPAGLRYAEQRVGASSSLVLESLPMSNVRNANSVNSLLHEEYINSFMDNTSDVASLFNLEPSLKKHKVTLEARDIEPKGDTTNSEVQLEMPDGIKITSVMKTSESAKDASFIDANPTKPWMVIATTLNDGTINILYYDNHDRQKPMGSFRVMNKGSDFVTKFIAREQWLMISAADGFIRVYSYEAQLKMIKCFSVGSSLVSSMAIHPTKTYVLTTCPKTGLIKLWDWGKDWECIKIFGHESSFGVCQVVFNPNPKDANSFASASNNRTVKLWYIDYPKCSHTLIGHQDKVNCMDFFKTGDQQYYLITGSEDKTAKIWDIQKTTCVHTLGGFMSPVVCVFAHPNLQVLITGTLDGIVHVWSSTDYRLKRIFNIGGNGEVLSLALACSDRSKRVLIGQKKAVSIMDFVDKDDIKKGQKDLEIQRCKLEIDMQIKNLENLLSNPYAEPAPQTYELIQKITHDFGRRIGTGGRGEVFVGLLGKRKKVAVKKVKYTGQRNVDELFRSEVDCFKRAKHENIVRLLGYCAEIPREISEDTNGNDYFIDNKISFLCLEYAPYGDLQKYIDGSSGDNWITYYQMIMGICHGLDHIHKQNIIHLNLKPKNIFLDAYMRPKITDFSLSKCLAEGQSTLIVECSAGTEGFMAPELKDGTEISCKSDIYALGATIACLLMRNNRDVTVEKWLEESSSDNNCPKEKKGFIDIARSCMRHDPNERKTLQEIIDQLRKMEQNDLNVYDSEDLIKVVPREMRFRPFDLENVVSSTVSLVNRTGHYVAYKISRKSTDIEHSRDIIGPRETRAIDMPREASETFLVQSTVVTKVIDKPDFFVDMFRKVVDGRRIYEVDVGIFVEAPPQQHPLEGLNRLQINVDGAPEHTSSQDIQDFIAPLDIHPSELHIPFEPNKCIPCLLDLRNNTNRLVWFKLEDRYQWVMKGNDLVGVVPPKSTYSLIVMAEKQQMLPLKRLGNKDILILRSGLCGDGSEHNVELKAVYMTPGEIMHEEITHGTKITSIMRYPTCRLISVEANPIEPWVAMVDKDHIARIMNYDAQTQRIMRRSKDQVLHSDFQPKFFTQREWITTPSLNDIDIYNYEMQKIDTIKAGSSKVVQLAVHPTKLSLLSIGKFKEIQMWDWDNVWKSTYTFVTELSTLGLNQMVFNPKNTQYNIFATTWKDHTIKFWDLGSSQCSHTLFGHKNKVNCLDFVTLEDQQQYLITGSEDKTAKIWDIQKMSLVHTLEGFMSPVLCIFGHPTLPLLITGTEDGIVHIWSSTNFRLKRIFNIGCSGKVLSLSLACPVESKRVVIGQEYAVSIMDFGELPDIKNKDQNQLETLKFREPEPETREDIIHFLPVSLEQNRPLEKNYSLVLESLPSLERKSVCAVLDKRSDCPTSVPAINEINQLLSKVDVLAQSVQNTGERLSRICSLFPPGHGPSVEALEEATNYDVAVLESLKLAIFYIRDSFVKLGKKQDAICREFEREGVLIGRQKNQQDDTVVLAVVEETKCTETSGEASAAN